jgi:hypothetical protein
MFKKLEPRNLVYMIERSVKYMPNLQPFFPGATSGVVVSNAVNAAGSCVRVAAAGGVSRKDKGQSPCPGSFKMVWKK